MANETYSQQIDMKNIDMIRNIQSELPDYMRHFFRSIQQSKSSRTRLGYARDIKNFFEYIVETYTEADLKSPKGCNS